MKQNNVIISLPLYILVSIFMISCTKNASFKELALQPSNNTATNSNIQVRDCTSPPVNATGGVETSIDGGKTWGSCVGFTCDASYTNVAGICQLTNQTRSYLVQPSNSTGGTESTTDGGQTCGSCVGFTCDASYTNVAGICQLTNQARSCLVQPSNSTGGTESTTDGGQTWGSCTGFICATGYTSNGSTCDINSYQITITKNLTMGSIDDITLAQLLLTPSDLTKNSSYNHGQMIVFEATPNVGYDLVSWTGCDSVSGDLKRCTISSLSSALNISLNSSCSSGYTQSGNSCIPASNFQSKIDNFNIGMRNGCAIDNTKTPYCWGASVSYVTTNASGLPDPVNMGGILTGKEAKKIFSGHNIACMIAGDSGTSSNDLLYCWGDNALGRSVGYESSNIPVQIEHTGTLIGKTIKDVALASNAHCLLASDGVVYCWGNASNGELGTGQMSENAFAPIAVKMNGELNGKTIIQIESDMYSGFYAITDDNNIYCWGMCSTISPYSYAEPTLIKIGLIASETIIKITAGSTSMCVLTDNNKVFCRGYNNWGQLGNNSTIDSENWIQINSSPAILGKTIIDVSIVGYGSRTCLLTDDNNIFCTGIDSTWVFDGSLVYTQLNDTTTLSTKTMSQLVSGAEETCVINTDKTIYCFDGNGNYEWGVGHTNTQYSDWQQIITSLNL